eukprot:362831-Chlamydomonas_euryale.AAC.5
MTHVTAATGAVRCSPAFKATGESTSVPRRCHACLYAAALSGSMPASCTPPCRTSRRQYASVGRSALSGMATTSPSRSIRIVQRAWNGSRCCAADGSPGGGAGRGR